MPAPVAAGDGGVLVNTVLGPLSTTQLGCVMTHEHVCISSAGMPQVYPGFFPRDQVMKDALEKLGEYRLSPADRSLAAEIRDRL